jgi:hypothetical protein
MEPTIIEEECENIVSPPRHIGSASHIPQHERLKLISGAVNDDHLVEINPITPQRPNTYKYTTPTRKGKSLDDLFHRNTQVKYYRIIYRGVVSLLSKPDENSKKSGAYVSYGEIIASLNELDVPVVDPSEKKSDENDTILSSKSPQSTSSAISASTSAAASHVPSTTSTSLPLAPSISFIRNNHNIHNNHTREQARAVRRIIQVDEVLTGGYAIDASNTATSHTHCTPIRSNSKNVSFAHPNTAPEKHCASPATPQNEKVGGGIISMPIKHHGYLFESRNGMPIAECIPSPPLLCQSGTFYYRVISKTPLPILAGPCADAPQMRAMVLPGTVHEISLRMGSLDRTGSGNGMQDGIVYLRLSHRRGWIADRRFVTSFLHGRNISGQQSQYGRSMSGYVDNASVSVEDVMKEVSDYVDVTTIGIRDDISLGATSISTNSISTPANIIRTRRRSVRRRDKKDIRSGMIVQPKNGVAARIRKGGAVRNKNGEASSPRSDLSFVSDPSNIRTSTGDTGRSRKSMTNSDAHTLESMRLSSQSMNNPQMKPDIFLLRVTAVNGLKILDAPHFQVNNLIRGQSAGAFSGLKKKRDLLNNKLGNKTNPPSIFPASAPHGGTQPKSDGTSSWVFEVNGKYRMLPRGALFEASKRIERAPSNYPPGSGLIKLADNTGWAIVPNQAGLQEQYQLHKVNAGIGISEVEALQAYEEVGNAIETNDKRSRSNDENVLWVRVVQQTGVLVSCSSVENDAEVGKSGIPTTHSLSHSPPQRRQDADAASTVSSAFFDAFRPSRKPEARLDSLVVGTSNNLTKLQALKNSSGPVIPCGNCIKVKPWASSTSQPENQSFVRLCSGQGWIPRIIHGAHYSVDIKQPDARCGSFWFRVQPSNGVQVRIGPSGRSRAIKSDNGYFQFECGEYLRASEVLTIHGHADTDDDANEVGHPSESFAKLYRNNGGLSNEESNFLSLSTLTAPGEWVHVHCNGYLYLEECVNPPSIERHHDGWRFEVVDEAGVQIRRGPSFSATQTGSTLLHCASVLINEKVTASGESLTWLRLKDGRGWIHNISEQGGIVLKAHTSKKNELKDGSVNKLISRLGLR